MRFPVVWMLVFLLNLAAADDRAGFPDGGISGSLLHLTSLSSGRSVLSGYIFSVHGTTNRTAAVLRPDGRLAEDVIPILNNSDNGLLTKSAAATGDGGFFICGIFNEFNGVKCTNLVKLKADGSVDTAFVPDVPPGIFPRCLTALPDGGILVAGGQASLNGVVAGRGRGCVVRYGPTGIKDPNFVTQASGNVYMKLVLAGDGGFYLTQVSVYAEPPTVEFGEVRGTNVVIQRNVARFGADGTHDATFKPVLDFKPRGGFTMRHVIGLVPLSDRKILLAGTFSTVNGRTRPGWARLNEDGSLDETFVPEFPAAAIDPAVFVFEQFPDGDLLVGWQDSNLTGLSSTQLSRFRPDGRRVRDYPERRVGGVPVELACAPLLDGSVHLAGAFTNVDGQPRRGFAWFLPSGVLGTDQALQLLYKSPGQSSAHSLEVVVRAPGQVKVEYSDDWQPWSPLAPDGGAGLTFPVPDEAPGGRVRAFRATLQ